MPASNEARLVTSDEFIADIIYALRLRGDREIELQNNEWDSNFAKAYDRLWEKRDELGVAVDFALSVNRLHGDSTVMREALYALRERKVVAINNPKFMRVTLRVEDDVAERRLDKSQIGRSFIEDLVARFFPCETEAAI